MSTNQEHDAAIEPGETYAPDELPRNELTASGGLEFHDDRTALLVGDNVYALELKVEVTEVSDADEVVGDDIRHCSDCQQKGMLAKQAIHHEQETGHETHD